MFANQGDHEFVDVARATAADVRRDSRGVAVADLDGDGRLDLVITANDAPPTVLMNRLPTSGNWVELELEASAGNRDAVGARVRLSAGGITMTRTIEAGSGYATQSPHRLHFGLGPADEIDRLEIDWPGGASLSLTGERLRRLVPVNRSSRLREQAKSQEARKSGSEAVEEG